jgi:hypothetical protein
VTYFHSSKRLRWFTLVLIILLRIPFSSSRATQERRVSVSLDVSVPVHRIKFITWEGYRLSSIFEGLSPMPQVNRFHLRYARHGETSVVHRGRLTLAKLYSTDSSAPCSANKRAFGSGSPPKARNVLGCYGHYMWEDSRTCTVGCGGDVYSFYYSNALLAPWEDGWTICGDACGEPRCGHDECQCTSLY